MKVAIITHPLHSNYGGLLQAYALQKAIVGLSHDAITVRYASFIKGIPVNALSSFLSWLKAMLYEKISLPTCFSRIPILKNFTQSRTIGKQVRFRKENIWTTHLCKSPLSHRDVQRINADAWVVGSDQVWRYAMIRHQEFMFLSFLSPKQRKCSFAYAASFGTDCWEMPTDVQEKCSHLVNDFKAVSVREESGIDLCRTYLQREAVWMPDPTLLLTVDDYNMLINKTAVRNDQTKKPYIAYYILGLDEIKGDILKNLSRENNLPLVDVAYEQGLNYRLQSPENLTYRSVEEWLTIIRDAAYVITDSFHGSVFSIIFNTSFYVLSHEKGGNARMDTLLAKFNLTDRRFAQEQAKVLIPIQETEWKKVNMLLSQYRNRGINFIKDNLQ